MSKTKIDSKIFPMINVSSQNIFDLYCFSHNLDDSNVEDSTDSAFISIIGTKACLEHYLKEPNTKHWFNDNHPNVLNLEFDDLPTDEYWWYGHKFEGMTMQQASDVVDFVDKLVAEAKLMGDDFKRNFYIHCKAGISRSMAIGAFLRDFYPDYFTAEYKLGEGYNHDVYAKLSRVWHIKHGMLSGNGQKDE